MGETISLNHIAKRFEDLIILDDVSLQFPYGQVTAIMGPSGVGKTTLFHMMLGLIRPDTGTITGLHGVRAGVVFQENRLCESFDAITNVKMVLPHSVTTEEIEKEFEAVGLTDYQEKPVRELSGGMKRRVAIVRAVMMPSQILFMDEPFKGLDEQLKARVMHYVQERRDGRTLIFITHDRNEAQFYNANLVKLEKDIAKIR